MSDANRVGLSFVEESTFGESPGTQMKDFRWTGESLKQDTDSTTSSEIRSDRQITDVIRTNLRASGDINIELSYQAYEEMIEAALLSANITSEVTVASSDTGVSAAASDNSLNHTSSWDNTPNAGDWIRIDGFTGDTSNNGYARVVSATSSKIIVSQKTLVDDAAGEAVSVKVGQMMTNGTTARTFHIEKGFTDLSNEFVTYGGMMPDTFNLAIAVEAIITGSFSFLGKSETSQTATTGTGSNAAAPTNDIMNAIDNVTAILENGSASFDATNFTMALVNNLRARTKISALGAISIGTGSIGVTGSLEMYFTSKTLMDKYRAFTKTSLALVCEDNDGNGFVIDFPSIKFTDGNQNASGINTDVVANMEYTAYMDSTLGYTVRVTQFDA